MVCSSSLCFNSCYKLNCVPPKFIRGSPFTPSVKVFGMGPLGLALMFSLLSLSISLPDTVTRWASANQREGLPQNLAILAPRSQTSSLGTVREYISIV